MKKNIRLLAAPLTLLLLGWACWPSSLLAGEKDPTIPQDPGLVMTADLALARPMGAVATVTGLALFLVSSPFSLLGGNAGEAWDKLVTAPAAYTFHRPLGCFEEARPQEPSKK